MAKAPPSFDLYPGDLIKSCVEMSAEEFGAYMRLLCYQWEHGFVPCRRDQMARICGMDKTEFESIWGVLASRFKDQKDENLKVMVKVQERLLEQRQKSIEVWQKRKEGGSKGGRPRKTREKQKPQGSSQETSTEEGSRKKEVGREKKKEVFNPTALELPFDTDKFRSAWSDWCDNRSEIKKPYTPTSAKTALKKLAAMGHNRAVSALVHSTANGWQGIFEPTGNNMEPSPEPKLKPKPLDGSAARYQLIKIHKISEAREWSESKCLDELRHRLAKTPPKPVSNQPGVIPHEA